MRTTLVSATLAGFCFAGLSAATSFRNESVQTSSAGLSSSSQGFQEHRVNSLLGMRVENPDGQLLGRLKDFVVNLQSGRVSYALISSGGFLGLGSRVRAVPLEELSLATTKRGTLEAAVSPARWRHLPAVKRKDLKALASEVIGQSVVNRQGEKVAKVSDLLVNVGGQKPAQAILSPTASVKSAHRGTLTVPLRSLTPTTGDQVILNTEHSTLITKG